MELKVNYQKGVNDIVFGMSPEDVLALLGNADLTTKALGGEDTDLPIKRTEIRNKVQFLYENEELVCISGDLGAPFFLDEDRIPYTFIEACRILKDKSKLNMRFSKSTSYVFADLGIVLHPYEISDIEAGIPITNTKFKLVICNDEVLARYSKYFIKNEGPNNFLLEELGEFVEEYD